MVFGRPLILFFLVFTSLPNFCQGLLTYQQPISTNPGSISYHFCQPSPASPLTKALCFGAQIGLRITVASTWLQVLVKLKKKKKLLKKHEK